MKTIHSLAEDITPIGMVGDDMVGLALTDRIGITRFFGGRGSGKSVALTVMVISNIIHGNGGMFIDPYGDIADEILKRVPTNLKPKIAVFDLQEGDLISNINRFEKEIHFTEMRSDNQKFLLIKLHGSMLEEDIRRKFGIFLVKSFFESVGENGNLSNRALYLDEAYNYLDEINLTSILQSKDKGLQTVLLDQSTGTYSNELLEQLSNATNHLLCGIADETTRSYLSKQEQFGFSEGALNALKQYHWLASITADGVRQPTTSLRGVFPIPFPEMNLAVGY